MVTTRKPPTKAPAKKRAAGVDAIHFVGDTCPGAHADQGAKLPLKEQHDVLMRALRAFWSEDEAARWLASPHGELGGRPPRTLLFAGRFADAWRMIEELRQSLAKMDAHAADIHDWLRNGDQEELENALRSLGAEPPDATLTRTRHAYAESFGVPDEALTVRLDGDTTLRVYVTPAYQELVGERLRTVYAGENDLPVERVRVSFTDDGEPKVVLHPLKPASVIAVDLKLDRAEITLDLEPPK